MQGMKLHFKRSQHAGAYTFGFFIHSNSPFSPFFDLFILTHLFPNFVNLIIQMVLFTNISYQFWFSINFLRLIWDSFKIHLRLIWDQFETRLPWESFETHIESDFVVKDLNLLSLVFIWIHNSFIHSYIIMNFGPRVGGGCVSFLHFFRKILRWHVFLISHYLCI